MTSPRPAGPPAPPPPPVGHPAAAAAPADPEPWRAAPEPAFTAAEPPAYSAPQPPAYRSPEPTYAPPEPAAVPAMLAVAPEDVIDRRAASTPTPSRHAVADPTVPEHTPDGQRVLLIGGLEPLGGIVAERLLTGRHRLAVHAVAIPDGAAQTVIGDRSPHGGPAPVAVPGDRTDTEEMLRTVAGAEIALGGLDAIVILPSGRTAAIGIDADAATWADTWSSTLATEVLSVSCAAHTAARSFLGRRRAGRIVLVTHRPDPSAGAAMPGATVDAAITALGGELARELGPHGIGVSVVAAGAGSDFAVGQVADVIEALLATPTLSSLTARVG